MKRRAFGKTGLEVSVLGLGGYELGDARLGNATAEVDRIVGVAREVGINTIDTAACYGASEDRLGHALEGRRDDFVLMSKCGHGDVELLGPAPGRYVERVRQLVARRRSGRDPLHFAPAVLRASIERSLRRLRTDRLDVLFLHAAGSEPGMVRDDGILEVLTDARRSGKVRFLGYSGDNQGARDALALGVFDALQTSVSVADQAALDDLLPRAAALGLGVVAKRPIANAAWGPAAPTEYAAPYWRRLRALDYPALRDPSAAAGAALRFTLAVPGVSTAIVGTTRASRVRENAALLEGAPLDGAIVDAMRARWTHLAEGRWPQEG